MSLTKLIINGAVASAFLTAGLGHAPHAEATNYCTFDYPYPPPGQICLSLGVYDGDSCGAGMACSPNVPAIPGTRGPWGFTPCGGPNGYSEFCGPHSD